MQVWNVLHAARWKCRPKTSPKICHLCTIAQLCRAIASQLRHVSTIGKKRVKQQYLPTCPYNMVNFGLIAAEIVLSVWGTPANFSGFCVWAALLHGTLVLGVSKTLRRWTDGATYIRQAAVTLGIRPHCSFSCFFSKSKVLLQSVQILNFAVFRLFCRTNSVQPSQCVDNTELSTVEWLSQIEMKLLQTVIISI